MRDSYGKVVTTRQANQFYEKGLSLKPSISQEQLKHNLMKSNQNELLRQISEKKRQKEE